MTGSASLCQVRDRCRTWRMMFTILLEVRLGLLGHVYRLHRCLFQLSVKLLRRQLLPS